MATCRHAGRDVAVVAAVVFWVRGLRLNLLQLHSLRRSAMTSKSASCLLVAGVFLVGLGGCATDRTATERNQTLTEKTEDGWITTKIKSEFVLDKTVSATEIHVNTDNGVVHL